MSSALLSVTDQLDEVEQNNRVLAVDDDEVVLEYYREVFDREESRHQQIRSALVETMGEEYEAEDGAQRYALQTASSGEEGVQLAQEALVAHAPYSVALVDMRMPGGMNGLEAAHALRELDPRIMLVIVTAYTDHQLEEI